MTENTLVFTQTSGKIINRGPNLPVAKSFSLAAFVTEKLLLGGEQHFSVMLKGTFVQLTTQYKAWALLNSIIQI